MLPRLASSKSASEQRKGQFMSHYYSGPDYGSPHGDARLDLTDHGSDIKILSLLLD